MCVIIGGGQGGIALGARLRQLGVPTIIVEKNERAGDSWRKRYKSLCLHDPVWYDHLPYIDFPEELAGVLAEGQDRRLAGNVHQGHGAELLDQHHRQVSATYDEAKKEWTVVVERDGKEIVLKPKQLVFATGMSGKANMPQFKGMDRFKGEQHHSSQHPGPDGYKGKKVVVIGSNNSAHDICAALYEAGVDVTMVQRSTHPYRAVGHADGDRAGRPLFRARGAGGMTTAKADLIFASLPYRILHDFQMPVYDKIREDDADFYAALEKAGFMLDFGDDDSGLFMKYLRRGSGYYIDIGASQLIIDGKIKLVAGQVRGDHRNRRHARRRHGASGRRHRLRHRLRLDERLGRRPHRPGSGRQGRQVLGPRLRHAQGPRPLGRRAAQHVEADPAGGASGSTAATCTSRATTRSSWRCS